MKEKRIRLTALALALSGIFVSSALAQVPENEPNHPIQSAQALSNVGADGCAEVSASLANPSSGSTATDVDFYSFRASINQVISVDIDNGINSVDSVDTWIGIFSPGPAFSRAFFNNDRPMREAKDPGSTHHFDARIDAFKIPSDGVWTVGVSTSRRPLDNGGIYCSSDPCGENIPLKPLDTNSGGTYTLRVCGIQPQEKPISIEVKPGVRKFAPVVNPKAKGVIPVALLGASDFDPMKVDVESLRFGSKGTEASLHRCNKDGHDINKDGFLDRLCHFNNELADFEEDEDTGILTGNLNKEAGGGAFKGNGLLKVHPVKQPE